MNRREFLITTLAAFALSALPELTLAKSIAVAESVKKPINPQNKQGFGFMRLPLKKYSNRLNRKYPSLPGRFAMPQAWTAA